MRIALFATCIVDAMYPEVAKATVSILERLGHEVTFPERQACCGQMHINSGKFHDAYPVVRNHVRAFEEEDWDYAVAPSGSCVASLGHQHPMIAEYNGDPSLASRATDIASRTFELCQFLTDICGVTDAARDLGSWFPHTVAYHPSCHGMRLLRLGDRQRDLIASVEGLAVREIHNGDICCGFGGTFSVKNPDVSGAMLGDKVEAIIATGADACTGGDVSCLMHIGGGLSRTHRLVPGEGDVPAAVHLARILASTKEAPLLLPGEGAAVTGGALR
ncbi:(Fe-S)-binding protein [Corynebacterium bovis]|uniref:L-lactate dehydrogenase complex protein LldE n=1 Tax=Corynebacterium bovis DSM 20582 = CIP 54.80 TaxID=927655 RepID=A0A8I0CMU0_9CORY|nr:(Fe-S)-binding protein [Corynebacterium bovis]MBB3116099.1 L-lactate dehydrogenase complex protein LldE [Corynebacterium bovis DSM 20582 = CIP 54.80]QQC47030.1 (Fe-S)-binding protein [Corynebacterium bovis]RRO80538.1 (Fe-S)-binding protein [Corynebacterium bovis]RRO81515.1 (Fe-S)-binding protein [Corynebacterium bovis]RRO83122.1 (Fe-S)-binding protein [Corynebacterium bovis]